MTNKNLEEMKKVLEKEINGLILGGLSGGFQFCEERAQVLQELQDTMLYIFEQQESEIDALNDALNHANFQEGVRSRVITKLNENIETLNEIIGMYEMKEEKDPLTTK